MMENGSWRIARSALSGSRLNLGLMWPFERRVGCHMWAAESPLAVGWPQVGGEDRVFSSLLSRKTIRNKSIYPRPSSLRSGVHDERGLRDLRLATGGRVRGSR